MFLKSRLQILRMKCPLCTLQTTRGNGDQLVHIWGIIKALTTPTVFERLINNLKCIWHKFTLYFEQMQTVLRCMQSSLWPGLAFSFFSLLLTFLFTKVQFYLRLQLNAKNDLSSDRWTKAMICENQTWAILLGGVLVLGDIGVLLKAGIGIGYC